MPERITGTLNGTMHIETYPDHLSLVFVAGEDSTISIRFDSPEQVKEFCITIHKAALKIWPLNKLVDEYYTHINLE